MIENLLSKLVWSPKNLKHAVNREVSVVTLLKLEVIVNKTCRNWMPRESQLAECAQFCRRRWKLPEVCLESVHIFVWSHFYEPPMNTEYLPGTSEVPLCYFWPWACLYCAHFSVPQKKVRNDQSNYSKQVLHLEVLKWIFQSDLCKLKWTKIWLWSCSVFFFFQAESQVLWDKTESDANWYL